MAGIDRYVIVGLSVVLVIGIFLAFSDSEPEPDHTGIVHDVSETRSGYVFELLIDGRSDLRCFSRDRPLEFGYYSVSGSLSNDGSMFFVSDISLLDSFSEDNIIDWMLP